MASESAATGSRRVARIGKYEVLAHVATGGMGAVYRARDTEDNKEVALKVLSAEMAAKPAMLERFRREARHAAKLRHDNIVSVYDCDEINGTYYIAMEFVEGIDLHDYIEQHGTLDPEESRQFMIQAARALAHAHEFGIVHRDIKPSNFLLAKKNGKTLVKLTDLGLARETTGDEFRVTRAGTTVGTVDYISPEQARDSGSADIRSDIYSLGCTWFHMLAGHPPFPEGGLAERLYKHMEAPPPDIRTLNHNVSRELATVLNKTLAKKPADRYQDPTELLHALNEMTAVGRATEKNEAAITADKRPTLAGAGSITAAQDAIKTKAVGIARKKDTQLPKKGGAATEGGKKARSAEASPERRRKLILIGAIGGGLLLIAGITTAAILLHGSNTPTTPIANNGGDDTTAKPAGPRDPGVVVIPPETVIKPQPVKEGRYKKRIYKLAEPVDPVALRARVEKPWTRVAVPHSATVIRVARLPVAKGDCTSLADAVSHAPADGPIIIEINDNGPLFEQGCAVTNRDVVVRAANGYRPLIIWDLGRSSAPAFMTVKGGSLTLQGLEIAVRTPEAAGPALTLLDLADCHLTVTDCVISAAGTNGSLTLAKMEGKPGYPLRCRSTRCFIRGATITALDIQAPGAEVLFDRCLAIGGEPPLLQVRNGNNPAVHLQIVQSSLLANKTLLQLGPDGSKNNAPALSCFLWDAILSRPGKDFGGKMLSLANREAPNTGWDGVKWESINALYAGWDVLRGPPKPLNMRGQEDVKAWQNAWGLKEVDTARRQPWPSGVLLGVDGLSANEFYPAENQVVAFVSTLSSDQPVGFDLKALPPSRDDWIGYLDDRFSSPLTGGAGDHDPPAILPASGAAYRGERIDLAMVKDVGKYLADKMQAQRPAEKVVVRLFNASNDGAQFSPLTIPSGTTLVLFYEFKPDEKPEDRRPLRLQVPPDREAEAVLATEGGGLELTNLEFVMPERGRKTPSVLLLVRGDLRLHNCILRNTFANTSENFKTLIDFQGSGDETPDRGNTLIVSQSVLMASHPHHVTALRLTGPGVRFLLLNSLILAAGDAVAMHLDDRFKGKANVQGELRHCTVAGGRAAVMLDNPSGNDVPSGPILLQTRECAFLNPFPIPPSGLPAGLFCAQGPALGRGLLLWRADGDVFDPRLRFVAASDTALPSRTARQPREAWAQLWGSPGSHGLTLDRDDSALFLETNAENYWVRYLDRLAVPPIKTIGGKDRFVGAKLADLPWKKKPR